MAFHSADSSETAVLCCLHKWPFAALWRLYWTLWWKRFRDFSGKQAKLSDRISLDTGLKLGIPLTTRVLTPMPFLQSKAMCMSTLLCFSSDTPSLATGALARTLSSFITHVFGPIPIQDVAFSCLPPSVCLSLCLSLSLSLCLSVCLSHSLTENNRSDEPNIRTERHHITPRSFQNAENQFRCFHRKYCFVIPSEGR